jgi:hypothetical protein
MLGGFNDIPWFIKWILKEKEKNMQGRWKCSHGNTSPHGEWYI